MPPKKTKRIRKQKTSNKSKKNTIKQNVKINISTSGGSGGGGTSLPAPIPVQSFARSEKTGENVAVTNLLNRIGYQQAQQARAFDNFSNIINSSMMQREQINRDDKIDAAEKINNGIDGDEDKEIIIFPNFSFFDEEIPKFSNIPIITPTADTSTQTLLEMIPTQTIETQTVPQEEPQEEPEQIMDTSPPPPIAAQNKRLIETPDERAMNMPTVTGGGGGGATSDSTQQEVLPPSITVNNLKGGKKTFTLTNRSISIGTFDDLNKAKTEKQKFDTFFKDAPKIGRDEIRNYAKSRKDNNYN